MATLASFFGITTVASLSIPDNQLTWFDFLLKPELLKEHVAAIKAGEDVKPTVGDLLCTLLDLIVNSHPAAGLHCSGSQALALAEEALSSSCQEAAPSQPGSSLNKRSSALLHMASELALDFGLSLRDVEGVGRAPALLLGGMAATAERRGLPDQAKAAINLRRWVLRRSLRASVDTGDRVPLPPGPEGAAPTAHPSGPPPSSKGDPPECLPVGTAVRGNAAAPDEEWAVDYLCTAARSLDTLPDQDPTHAPPQPAQGMWALPLPERVAALAELAQYLLARSLPKDALRYADQALEVLEAASKGLPHQARLAVLPEEARELGQRLAGIKAAVLSCLQEALEVPAPRSPTVTEGPGTHGDQVTIAVIESLRRAGDWAAVVSLVERNLIGQLSGGGPRLFRNHHIFKKGKPWR